MFQDNLDKIINLYFELGEENYFPPMMRFYCAVLYNFYVDFVRSSSYL